MPRRRAASCPWAGLVVGFVAVIVLVVGPVIDFDYVVALAAPAIYALQAPSENSACPGSW
jgi:hypothetical protein